VANLVALGLVDVYEINDGPRPCGKEAWWCVHSFRHNTSNHWTDRQTDRQTEFLYEYRILVCWHMIESDGSSGSSSNNNNNNTHTCKAP